MGAGMESVNHGTVREEMEAGKFVRQEDAFRDWIGEGREYPAVADRYHLYVSLACPWASRTVIVRKWLELDRVIGMTVVDPIRDEKGWAFREGSGHDKDPVNGWEYLSEAYHATDPDFDGRVTVPVLWDKERKRIVNNSEDDICRMFQDGFRELGNGRDLFPKDIEREHAKMAEWIY